MRSRRDVSSRKREDFRMREAFEVGVSLALSGSVSAEMAKAREEVSRLEAVLLSCGVSVQQLRRFAVGTSAKPSVAPDGNLRFGDVGSTASSELPSTARFTPERPTQHASAEASTTAVRQPTMIANTIVGSRRTAQLMTDNDGLSLPASVTNQPVVSPKSHSSAVPTTRVGEPLIAASQTPGAISVPSAQSSVARPKAQLSRTELDARLIGALPAAPRSAQQTISTSNRVHRASEIASVAVDLAKPAYQDNGELKYKEAPERYSFEASGNGVWPDLPSAPRLPPRAKLDAHGTSSGGVSAFGILSEARGDTPSTSTASRQVSGRSGDSETRRDQIQGDVFLDGALVGRWISRLLSCEAERASVGPTGFDTRRGRLMPGATVGG